MRCWVFLLVAAIVVAYQMQETDAKFSFSLPAKWGSQAKRGRSFTFTLPGKWGSGKRSGDLGGCGELDPETMYYLYSLIQAEGARISECLGSKMENEVEDAEKH